MESEVNRYVGPPTTGYAYAREFWVECPKCAKTIRVTTMVEKRPQFIKAAKNREAVLKAIERMLKK